MRLITSDDIIETYSKIYQRGYRYVLSKLTLSGINRTKSTFNNPEVESDSYWIIPRIRQRWNSIITGDENVSYESYVVDKYFERRENLTLLSLGSGMCSHEMLFAKYPCFASVRCVDFSEKILEKAKQIAQEQDLKNIFFEPADVNSFHIEPNSYDLILFHSSLHHFKNIQFLLSKAKAGLKSNGFLVINEYVGPDRLQIDRIQLKEINRLLKDEIPKNYRKRCLTNNNKKNVSGSGILRMIITDPSEAVESSRIIPSIRELFETVEEKKIGGDLLMWIFKDIAHNFLNDNRETNEILDKVFCAEDEYLRGKDSDFVFGVYKTKD
jgi:ubiquinone/menaquinone biosynthesis C-methylase UbiE